MTCAAAAASAQSLCLNITPSPSCHVLLWVVWVTITVLLNCFSLQGFCRPAFCPLADDAHCYCYMGELYMACNLKNAFQDKICWGIQGGGCESWNMTQNDSGTFGITHLLHVQSAATV